MIGIVHIQTQINGEKYMKLKHFFIGFVVLAISYMSNISAVESRRINPTGEIWQYYSDTTTGIITSTITAADSNGLCIVDDSNNLGLCVEDGGQVGVGTSTPTEALDVDGNIQTNYGVIASTGVYSTSVAISGASVIEFSEASAKIYSSSGTPDQIEIECKEVMIDGDINYTRANFYDEMWNGIFAAWATDVTTGSTAPQARNNGWYRFTTGATTTNEESIDWDDIVTFINTTQPRFEIRLDLEEIDDTEVEVGLKESEGVGTDDYIMISFDPSAQATWFCEASTGGSATTDQGSAADTNDVLLSFEFTSDTAIEWFIDGVSQGTISSNVPTVALQPFIRIRTEADAAHYIEVDLVKLWQDRS